MVLCTCFLCDHVIYVLKEEIAEPRRCVESDRNPYCVNFWKHPRVICHRLLITGNQFESKVQELPVLDLLFQFLPQCFMVHCRITVVDIQLQDFTCPDRVTLYPVFNHLSCSVRTFTRYASAGELVGSVFNNLSEDLNERMMDALIWIEPRHGDDSLFLLDAVIDFSDRVFCRNEGFIHEHFLNLSCITVDVIQDSLHGRPMRFPLRCPFDRTFDILNIRHSLEQMPDSLRPYDVFKFL